MFTAPVSFSNEKEINTRDTSIISQYIHRAQEFREMSDKRDYDSTFFYLNKALELSEKLKNEEYQYMVYDAFTDVLIKTGNFSFALDYYFKMLKILDEEMRKGRNLIETRKKYESLYKDIGTCMGIYVKDYKTAIIYFRKSLVMSEEIHAALPSYPIDDNKIRIYNNIGSAYIHTNKFDSAQYYFLKALSYIKNNITDSRFASLYNNLGIVETELKNYDKSREYFNQALRIHQKENDSIAMGNVYLNIGICFIKLDKYHEALVELNKSLDYLKKMSEPRGELLAVQALAGCYEMLKEYEKSNEMYVWASILKDSISSVEKVKSSIQAELQYQFEKQEKEKEFQQKIILAKKERTIVIYILIAVLLLTISIILLLLYRNQRVKGKQSILEQESLALQNENLELKNKQLEQDLEYKKKEMDMQLMYLLQKKDFVSSIIDQVLEVKEQDPIHMKSVIKNLKNDMEDSVSNEFKLLFQELHQDFYTNLYSKHPDLTPNEKKLCAFIRLNMSSKDISSITFQSVKSIEIARSRLRARMNLDRKENLTLYLQQF